MSVEIWGHNFSCEATIVSCSVIRYEFKVGMVKMGFPLLRHCNSVVCVLSKYTVLINYSGESHLNPIVLGFAYVLLL